MSGVSQTARVRRALRAHCARFLQFGLVGISGVLVNSAVLYLLVAHAGWSHLPAAAGSSEAAMISNFALNDRWTFRDISNRIGWPARLVRYNTIALGGMAISLGVLAVLTLGFGINYLLANLIGIVVSMLWNYGVNALYTWNIHGVGRRSSLEFATTTEG